MSPFHVCSVTLEIRKNWPKKSSLTWNTEKATQQRGGIRLLFVSSDLKAFPVQHREVCRGRTMWPWKRETKPGKNYQERIPLWGWRHTGCWPSSVPSTSSVHKGWSLPAFFHGPWWKRNTLAVRKCFSFPWRYQRQQGEQIWFGKYKEVTLTRSCISADRNGMRGSPITQQKMYRRKWNREMGSSAALFSCDGIKYEKVLCITLTWEKHNVTFFRLIHFSSKVGRWKLIRVFCDLLLP